MLKNCNLHKSATTTPATSRPELQAISTFFMPTQCVKGARLDFGHECCGGTFVLAMPWLSQVRGGRSRSESVDGWISSAIVRRPRGLARVTPDIGKDPEHLDYSIPYVSRFHIPCYFAHVSITTLFFTTRIMRRSVRWWARVMLCIHIEYTPRVSEAS